VDPVEVVALVVIVAILGGAILWWLLFTTEGVYLGRRVVIWLYDVYARRYDNIKQYDPAMEAVTLGFPILQALADLRAPLILDVAAGTGRLPLALFGQPAFNGHIIALDYSRRMLTVAAEKIAALTSNVDLIYQSAQHLPFDDDTFDMVTCLEALEFMPDQDAVIAEIVRVARPGAFILLTNRKGTRLMPGKTQSRDAIADKLRVQFGLVNVSVEIWQVDYDQVWACKPGASVYIPAPFQRLEAVLCCPTCGKRALARTAEACITCADCSTQIPVAADGVVEYARSYR
jgi:ubiquinone/menaquinone biosynthesis C-methylase UbiE